MQIDNDCVSCGKEMQEPETQCEVCEDPLCEQCAAYGEDMCDACAEDFESELE